MKNNFLSVYASHIKKFIEMKELLGFKFKKGKYILSLIDQFALQREETSLGINKDFAIAWSKKNPNHSNHYHYERIVYLAQFSSYLQDMGITSYVPKLPICPKSTFVPYIFSDKEIEALFKVADDLQLGIVHKDSALISFPTILRLLYATGLRISEVLALKDEDVNLEEQYLRVKDSKNEKKRIIPISESLVKVCKTYQQYRDHLPLKNDQVNHFFTRINGQPCSHRSISNWYRKCLAKISTSHTGGKHGPRLHDLRHTFAVNAMAKMVKVGLDLYVSLPILSNYLGHQSLTATEHYVRLTSYHFPDLIKDVDMICLNVFPKFEKDETNRLL